ncbi:hypothetical protein ACOMHN_032193 [Nucella lapillus]
MAALVQRSPVKITQSSPNPNLQSSDIVLPRTYTRNDVAEHCDVTDCWIIVEEKVYDVTKFLEEHPGGADIIVEYAGGDASAAFYDKGHSRDAVTMLGDYYVGQLRNVPHKS